MVQEVELLRVEDELFQIESASKEGERGRGHRIEWPPFVGSDYESPEKRKWTGTEFGVRNDVLPVILKEFKMPDLLKMRREEGNSAGGRIATGGHIQGRSFCALEEGSHVGLAFSEE